MGAKTRILLGGLMRGSRGLASVELPEEITLYCPQCGEKIGDKGQCLAGFTEVDADEEMPRARNQLKITVMNCRVCGCVDKTPTTLPLNEDADS